MFEHFSFHLLYNDNNIDAMFFTTKYSLDTKLVYNCSVIALISVTLYEKIAAGNQIDILELSSTDFDKHL